MGNTFQLHCIISIFGLTGFASLSRVYNMMITRPSHCIYQQYVVVGVKVTCTVNYFLI